VLPLIGLISTRIITGAYRLNTVIYLTVSCPFRPILNLPK
jgi:hypothetical protein